MRSRSGDLHQSPRHCARDHRYVRNLAAALSTAMNICPGNQLVIHLGAGDEQTNLEALETWTRYQLPQLTEMTTAQVLAELLPRLEKRLANLEAAL